MNAKDYKSALLSQGACNLSGLVHSLSAMLPQIWEECDGTRQVNEHPIVVLFTAQIAYLSKYDYGMNYAEALAICEQKAKEESDEIPAHG